MTRWERIGVALWLAGCLLVGVALAHAVTVPGPSRNVFSSPVLLPDGSASAPALALSREPETGFYYSLNSPNGWVGLFSGGNGQWTLGWDGIVLRGGTPLGWSSGAIQPAPADVTLRDAGAPDTLALRRGTNAQKFILGAGDAPGRLDFGVSGAQAPNPGANLVTLYVDESTNRGGGGAADCALVARKSDGTEVVVATLVTDGGCP